MPLGTFQKTSVRGGLFICLRRFEQDNVVVSQLLVRCESLRVGKEMGIVLQKGGFWYNV